MISKVVYTEDNNGKGIIRRTNKEVVGCIQAVIVKEKFPVKFKGCQRREMRSCSLSHECSKEEVGQEVNNIIYELLKKNKENFDY